MGLKPEGIFFLVFAWGIIFSLIIFCFYKVLKGDSKKEK